MEETKSSSRATLRQRELHNGTVKAHHKAMPDICDSQIASLSLTRKYASDPISLTKRIKTKPKKWDTMRTSVNKENKELMLKVEIKLDTSKKTLNLKQ